VRRVKLRFADREVEFVDRDVALRQLEELADRGAYYPLVVYGPEGCGKTALLKQAKEVLKEHGYAVVYVNPVTDVLEERFSFTEELRALLADAGGLLLGDVVQLIERGIRLLYEAVKRGLRKRIAFLADDVFQAVELNYAELLVKRFLNMIKYPSVDYEKIIVVVMSSEGVTWERIGRHCWADILTMWNMPSDGLKRLYELLPGEKPPFEEVWRWTGGNPMYLEKLYRARWNVDGVVNEIIESRKVTRSFVKSWRTHLQKALEDPDYLWEEPEGENLAEELVERNLVVMLKGRRPDAWVDKPPPERDPELGIGQYYAWQTPLHREAVRRALLG